MQGDDPGEELTVVHEQGVTLADDDADIPIPIPVLDQSFLGTLLVVLLTVAPVLAGGLSLQGLRGFVFLSVYLIALLSTPLLAYRLRDWGTSRRYRWARYVVGLGGASCLSTFKSVLLIPVLLGRDRSLQSTVLLYAGTALWECSNVVLVFGGSEMLAQLNITSYKHAVCAACAPCQVKFTHARRPGLMTKRVNLVVLWGLIGLGARALLQALPTIDSVVVEAEALAILLSSLVLVFDVPCLVWECLAIAVTFLCPAMQSVEVVLPYGAVYLSASPRDFWRRWSRPASQLIRHMVYYPLGGGKRAFVAIPIMFVLNACMHFQLSRDLVGDSSGSVWWLVIFGITGTAATIDVLVTEHIAPDPQEGARTLLLGWKAARWVLNYVSLRACAWLFVHKCLQLRLADFLEPAQ